MTEEQKTILIQQYLKGELPEPERRNVDRMIEADTRFAEDVAVMRLMLETLEDRELVQFHRRISSAWDDAEEEEEAPESTTQHSPPPFSTSVRRWLLAAAVLLSAAAVGVWWYNRIKSPPPVIVEQPSPLPPASPETRDISVEPAPPTPDQANHAPEQKMPEKQYIASAVKLANKYYAPPSELSDANPRKGNDRNTDSLTVDKQSKYSQARIAFSRGDHSKVLRLLSHPDSAELASSLMLRGHANFRLGRFKSAAKDFRAAKNKDSYLADQPDWYELLCQLAINGPNDEIVRKRLQDIAEKDPDHSYFDQAAKLWSEIKKE